MRGRGLEHVARALDVDAVDVPAVSLPEAVAGRVVDEQLATGERPVNARGIEQLQRAQLDVEPFQVSRVEIRARQRGDVVAVREQLADDARAHEAVGPGYKVRKLF